MGKRRKMSTLKTKRGMTPLFLGYTHLYIQFEDFETYGDDVPATVKKGMSEVAAMSEANLKRHGKERKAILVGREIGRELFPFVKATVTPVQKEGAVAGNEHRTFWMP